MHRFVFHIVVQLLCSCFLNLSANISYITHPIKYAAIKGQPTHFKSTFHVIRNNRNLEKSIHTQTPIKYIQIDGCIMDLIFIKLQNKKSEMKGSEVIITKFNPAPP
jgi:hypothetical protein